MMLSATNVMAETGTLLEYGTSEKPWNNSALTEWAVDGNPSPTITDNYVTITGGNGSNAMSVTATPTAYAILNVKAVWRGRSNTGRTFSQGNASKLECQRHTGRRRHVHIQRQEKDADHQQQLHQQRFVPDNELRS